MIGNYLRFIINTADMNIVRYGDVVDNYPHIPACTKEMLDAGEKYRETQQILAEK